MDLMIKRLKNSKGSKEEDRGRKDTRRINT